MSLIPSQSQFAKDGIHVSYNGESRPDLNLVFADRKLAIDKGLTVSSGDLNLTAGSITASAGAMTAGSLSISGNADVSSIQVRSDGLRVLSNGTFDKNLTVTQGLTVSGSSTVAGASSVTGAFSVGENSATSLGGSLTVANNMATNLYGTLEVRRNALLKQTLTVDGVSNLGGALNVAGDTAVNNLTVAAGKAVVLGGTMSVAGNAQFTQNLSVVALATMSGGLTVAEGADTNLGALTVAANKASLLKGTLEVRRNAALKEELDVDGDARFKQALTVTGQASMNGGLVVPAGKSATFNGPINVAANQAMTLSGIMSVGGDANFAGALTVANNKATLLGGTLEVTRNAALNASLEVSGDANFKGALSVDAGKLASLGGDLDVAGDADFMKDATVWGNADFKQDLTVRGNLTVVGNSTIVNSMVVQVKDQAILLAKGNTTDAVQTGIQFQYGEAKFAGLKRRTGANGGEFVLFKEASSEIENQNTVIATSDTFGNPINSSISGEHVTYGFAQAKKLKEYYIAALGTSVLKKWAIVAANANTAETVWDLIDRRTVDVTSSYSKFGGGNAASAAADKLNGFLDGTNHSYNGNSRAAYQYFRIIFESSNGADNREFKFAFAMKAFELDGSDVIVSAGTPTFMTASSITSSSALATLGGKASTFGALNTSISSASVVANIEVTRDLAGVYNSSNIYSGSVSSSASQWTISNSRVEDTYATLVADSFNCASDMNLKKNIVTIDHALDKLDGMRGVYHDWNDENNKEHAVGVIAQEVKAVFPQLVHEGGDGYLSVNYPKLTAVLLQAIKELKAIVMSK